MGGNRHGWVKSGSTIRLIVAEAAAIAINVVPLGLWFFEDYSAEATMIIYALESAAAMVFAVLCVLLVSPAYDAAGSTKYKRRSKLIGDFLAVSVGLTAAVSVFAGAFIFLVLKASVEVSLIASAFLIVLAFQLAEFVANVVTLRPLPLRNAEFLLTRSMGKSGLLFLGVFLGIFLAAFVDEWFVVPFVVLKTIADVGEPIEFFLGREQSGVPLEVEFTTKMR